MSSTQPTVFVVDDDRSICESLKLLIQSAGWQVQTFQTGKAFLSAPQLPGPSCLVLDLMLPDLSGLDVQRLVATRADMPIIFISGHTDVPSTVQAIKAGAVEFLTKPFSVDLLLDAIASAFERSRSELARAAELRALEDSYRSLTPREQAVMGLVVSGRLNKQVGGELGISEITVKAHRGRMMRKMHAHSLPELVLMAATLCLTPRRVERMARTP